jgi:hypothetical protein
MKDPVYRMVAVAVIVGLVSYPIADWGLAIFTGAVAFYVQVLIASGYRLGRAVVWGVLAVLISIPALLALPYPIRLLSGFAGFAWFLAGALSPGFRALWFGQPIE